MANRRMILKEDIESSKWQTLSLRQRYLYWALTLFADDDGIVQYYWINGRIFFPNDSIPKEVIDQDLSDLEVKSYIKVYSEDGGVFYIQVLRWWEKQYLDARQYKPTKFVTCPWYLKRPASLKKDLKEPFYDSDGKPHVQVNIVEENPTESISVNHRRAVVENAPDDVPWESDGSVALAYRHLPE